QEAGEVLPLGALDVVLRIHVPGLAVRPEHAGVDLVADLDHRDVHAGIAQQRQGGAGVLGDGIRQLSGIVLRPRRWHMLRTGIRPGVRIVEVDQHVHARVADPAGHLHGPLRGAVSVRRIYPDPQAAESRPAARHQLYGVDGLGAARRGVDGAVLLVLRDAG